MLMYCLLIIGNRFNPLFLEIHPYRSPLTTQPPSLSSYPIFLTTYTIQIQIFSLDDMKR